MYAGPGIARRTHTTVVLYRLVVDIIRDELAVGFIVAWFGAETVVEDASVGIVAFVVVRRIMHHESSHCTCDFIGTFLHEEVYVAGHEAVSEHPESRLRLVGRLLHFVHASEEFYGFICGIISQDHDLEQLYFDNFKRIGCVADDAIEEVLKKFEKLSEKTNVDFCFSMAVTEADVPESFKDKIIVSL